MHKEVEQSGGEASICEARFIDGLSDEQVEALFNAERDKEFGALGEEIRDLAKDLPAKNISQDERNELGAQVRRLKKRFDQIATLDLFRAPARGGVEGLLFALEAQLEPPEASEQTDGGPLAVASYRGRTWITRRGVHVDRMASAWLIRRFIDPQARFLFVAGKAHKSKEGELRFDMFDAEFTHEGDLCTFEVLIKRFGLKERGLTPIAEIVHDIDLKDAKFKRDETVGVAAAVAGIAIGTGDDEQRLAKGAILFEGLLSFFRAKRRN